jgi:hypothetical protein
VRVASHPSLMSGEDSSLKRNFGKQSAGRTRGVCGLTASS